MKKLLIILCLFTSFNTATAQQIQGLQRLDAAFAVYYSTGHNQRALSIQKRIDKAMNFFEKLVNFRPAITVFVLAEEDWKKHTSIPMVYGMPHYTEENKRLYLAATDNDMWKSFIPPVNVLPENLKTAVVNAYGNENGALSMQPFFDLLALHELSHAFQFQGELNVQRKWMGELFANIFLHTYIAEEEPGLLGALTVFPKMVIESGAKEFEYTTLQQLEENYNLIATTHPKNYGWYQCRWHAAAGEIFDKGGVATAGKIWNAFRKEKKNLNDDELIPFLEAQMLHDVASVAKNWNNNTRR